MIGKAIGLVAALGFAFSWAASVHAADPGNPDKGKAVFNRCRACHTFDPNGKSRLGPDLWGVVGRTAGTEPDYHYSDALKKAGAGGLVWTPEKLDTWLQGPRDLVPGNRMTFPGVKDPQQRADVIAYLATAAKK